MVLLSTLVAAFCLFFFVCVGGGGGGGESMVVSLAEFHTLAQPRIWLSDTAK